MSICTIDSEDFIDMIEKRLAIYWHWQSADFEDNPAWDYLCEYINELGNNDRSVMDIADNFHVNGSYGPIEDYVYIPEDCSEEERQRIIDAYLEENEDSMMYYDSDREYVIYSLG
jgi:hypothetical protein